MKITKSQLKKIIKEEVEFLEEGVDQDDRRRRAERSGRAALEILDAMLDTGTTSRAEILDDILIELGGEESHRIMLMFADSMRPPLELEDELRNP